MRPWMALLACAAWAIALRAEAAPARDLAQARTVDLVLAETSEGEGALQVLHMLSSLCSYAGLTIVDGPAEVELVLDITIENLGQPILIPQGPRPDIRWIDPSPAHLTFPGARVSGTLDFGGSRVAFDGQAPAQPEAPAAERAADLPDLPELPVVNGWTDEALLDSRLIEQFALLLGRVYGPERLMRAQLSEVWPVPEAAASALERLDPLWYQRPAAREWVPEVMKSLCSEGSLGGRSQELLPRIQPDWLTSEAFRQQVPQLIEQAGWPDGYRPGCARALLAQVSDPATAELLLPLLQHHDRRVRNVAHRVLVPLHDPRAVDPIVAYALEQSTEPWSGLPPDVGQWTAEDAVAALGRLGHPQAIEALFALVDPAIPVGAREAAIEVLGQLQEPRAFELLLPLVEDPILGLAAVRALGSLEDPRAIDVLLALGPGGGSEKAIAVATALAELGERRVLEPIVADLSCWSDQEDGRNTTPALIQALVTLGDPRAIRPLKYWANACSDDHTSRARATYLYALGALRRRS